MIFLVALKLGRIVLMQEGFTGAEKALMCISSETIEGLHMSGKKKSLLW